MRTLILVGLPAVAFTLTGCSGEISLAPSFDVDTEPSLAPMQPDPEAVAAALWVSQELTAPPDLYERIRNELRLIRQIHGSAIPAVQLKFHEPWEPGRLVVGFDDYTYEEISGGSYHAWDSLNSLYNVDRVDLSMPSFKILKIRFADALNPEVLAEVYAQLPGVRFAVPNRYMGDQPMLLPSDLDTRLLYYFRNAWGDCPSGCIHSEYWVFAVIRGEVIHDGYFAEIDQMPPDLQVGFDAAWGQYH